MKKAHLAGYAVSAVLMAIWAFTGNALHNAKGISLAEAHGICQSALGLFIRTANAQAATACANYENDYRWLMVTGIAGLVVFFVTTILVLKNLALKSEKTIHAQGSEQVKYRD